MSKILSKIDSILNKQDLIDESFNIDSQPDILPIITELARTNWFTGKRMQREACKRLIRIVDSNERVGQLFMKKLNKAIMDIGENIIKKVNEGYFNIKTEKKSKITEAKSDDSIKEAVDPIIQKIGDIIKNGDTKLVNLRPDLEKIFPKKDIDFTFTGAPHFRIKYKGKTLMVVNKKHIDGKPDLVVGDIAIGYNL